MTCNYEDLVDENKECADDFVDDFFRDTYVETLDY